MEEMRQHEFRAWDGKHMDYDYRDVSLWNGVLVAEGDTILLEYTGYKDKKDAKIYEGDIVQADWHWEKPHVIKWPDDQYDFLEYSLDSANIEVIGNIYENPELVDVK